MDRLIEQGCLDIWIDGIVPCLKDTETGELKETVVFKIESRSYLRNSKQLTVGTLIGTRYQAMLRCMPSRYGTQTKSRV